MTIENGIDSIRKKIGNKWVCFQKIVLEIESFESQSCHGAPHPFLPSRSLVSIYKLKMHTPSTLYKKEGNKSEKSNPMPTIRRLSDENWILRLQNV